MNALPIQSDQSRTRNQAGKPALGRYATTIAHHQFKPGHLPSLQTGGRSLRGGCATWRQTRAQAGTVRAARFLAIRPARHLGWYFASPREIIELNSLIRAGVDSRVAAQLVAQQSIAPGILKCVSERGPLHSSVAFRASSNALRIAQKRGRGRGIFIQGGGEVLRVRGRFFRGRGGDD